MKAHALPLIPIPPQNAGSLWADFKAIYVALAIFDLGLLSFKLRMDWYKSFSRQYWLCWASDNEGVLTKIENFAASE